MAIQDPLVFFRKQTELHLGLAGELARINIDSMESMVSTQLSPFKVLVVNLPGLFVADHNKKNACWEALCCSSIEYWKKCTLDGLAHQHRVLQMLANRSTE